jgi:hypothetical protein
MKSIFSLILTIPKLLALTEELISWMSDLIVCVKNKQALKKMDQAIQVSTITKDTSPLDAMFDPEKKK